MANAAPVPPPLPVVNVSQGSRCSGLPLDPDTTDDNEVPVLCNLDMFREKFITKIKPVAQSGPNCGMAALAMVASLTPKQSTVDEIFVEAKSRGFTNNGEMFSVRDMKALTDAIVSPWFKTEILYDGLAANKFHVVNKLFSGGLLLVPYDADNDHSPCCKGGHKAHWALVCGVGVTTDSAGSVQVLARHGKSRHLAAWSFDHLSCSNDNLTHLDPKRADDGRDYILPEGGVQKGLASQFIILQKENAL